MFAFRKGTTEHGLVQSLMKGVKAITIRLLRGEN